MSNLQKCKVLQVVTKSCQFRQFAVAKHGNRTKLIRKGYKKIKWRLSREDRSYTLRVDELFRKSFSPRSLCAKLLTYLLGESFSTAGRVNHRLSSPIAYPVTANA